MQKCCNAYPRAKDRSGLFLFNKRDGHNLIFSQHMKSNEQFNRVVWDGFQQWSCNSVPLSFGYGHACAAALTRHLQPQGRRESEPSSILLSHILHVHSKPINNTLGTDLTNNISWFFDRLRLAHWVYAEFLLQCVHTLKHLLMQQMYGLSLMFNNWSQNMLLKWKRLVQLGPGDYKPGVCQITSLNSWNSHNI